MKGLLDIQQDIKKLENSLDVITESLKKINHDVEKIRNAKQHIYIDFDKIELLAHNLHFGKHPLSKQKNEETSLLYIEMLLNIVRLDMDSKLTVNRFVFIQWLKSNAIITATLEDLFTDCYKMTQQSYYEASECIPNKYREIFILDALLIANIGGSANREVLEYVAELGSILNIAKEDIKKLALLAKSILCQSFAKISDTELDDLLTKLVDYKFYFINQTLITSCIISKRDIAVEVSDDEIYDGEQARWLVFDGQKISPGDALFEYRHTARGNIKRIRAKSIGRIFQFRNNNINYGVIAHETDDREAIKEWVKAGE